MGINIVEKEGGIVYTPRKYTRPFTLGSRVPVEEQKPTFGKPLKLGGYTSVDPESNKSVRVTKPLRAEDRDALIRTVLGEGVNQGPRGWAAIAQVVVNRVSDSRFPNTIYDVVHQPLQFSAWNSKSLTGNDNVRNYGPDTEVYQKIGTVVDQVLAGNISDGVGGATYYYAPRAMSTPYSKPSWFDAKTKERGSSPTIVGAHVFTGVTNYEGPKLTWQGFGLPNRVDGSNNIDFMTLPTTAPNSADFSSNSGTGDKNLTLLSEPDTPPEEYNDVGSSPLAAQQTYNLNLSNMYSGLDLSGSQILAIHNEQLKQFNSFVKTVTPI